MSGKNSESNFPFYLRPQKQQQQRRRRRQQQKKPKQNTEAGETKETSQEKKNTQKIS